MNIPENKQIPGLVKLNVSALKRIPKGLARRGIEDIQRIATDTEIFTLISIIKESVSWDKKCEAWGILRKMGPKYNGWEISLRDLIYDSTGWGQIFAAESLSNYECLAEEAIPILAATLDASLKANSHDWAIVASGALWKYRKDVKYFDSSVISILINALKSNEINVQGYSASILGYCGSTDQRALIELAKIHDSTSNHKLKLTCLYAMQQISSSIKEDNGR